MSNEQCGLLRELASNIQYQCLISVKCILCIIGAVSLCYQWRKQGVTFLIHNNTKTVFKFYYGLNLIVAIVFALFYVFELVRFPHSSTHKVNQNICI
ncbi:hypothetical protein PMAYCL1PPCAC_16824 [Pristionchus mayeri]|uniref:G protein-coupled receptor n=1 Tax=Pristionchus mayeri TaxID=1317129 RepID=A0AAN5CLN4_9BILA|nr:hypothetical protein PMAYCL1PPCAC_16824 [Pristionchus mayeri]